MKKYISTLLLSVAAVTGCATSSTQTSADIDLMKHQLAEIRNTKQLEKTNLETSMIWTSMYIAAKNG